MLNQLKLKNKNLTEKKLKTDLNEKSKKEISNKHFSTNSENSKILNEYKVHNFNFKNKKV